MRARIFALGAAMALGCTTTDDKPVAEEDFGDLALAGGKADHQTFLGTLSYGQQSWLVSYKNPPRYRAFAFTAAAGDQVEVDVRSTNGDAMAWVTDADLAVLGFNDDASSSTFDARVTLEMPAAGTFYILFREYGHQSATFRVSLDGVAAQPAECQVDADCAMVEVGCCAVGNWTSVPHDQVDAFQDAKDCSPNQVCPLQPIVYRGEQAICDVDTGLCEVALPEELACGGRSTNPHSCPDGWVCTGEQLAWDAPGTCARFCGGFGNLPCPSGLTCVDDPADDCDPATGADCGGICQ